MSTIKNNTTELQNILNTINNLPETGSGGEQATPVISVNNSNGLITATAGTKSSTYQMAFQPAQTITPGTTNKTIAANTYLGGVQTIKGDANLVASNIVSGKSIFGVVGTASAGGGDTSVEDGIITRNISGVYTNDRVTTIGSYAFYNCSSLTTVSFPVCTTISSYAFCSCGSLTTVSFPKVTIINSSAFRSCSSLTTANFPAATFVHRSAFYNCRSLTTANFPKLISISNDTFCGCSSLTTVSFPVCTSIGSNAFYYCGSLTTVSFPKVTTIGNNAFYNCSSLTTVSFPVCTTISSYAFCSCGGLTTVSFPKVTIINSSAFRSCSSLTTIYLMNSIVCSLVNSNAFASAGITPATGSIIVPTSLVSSYKAATNWAYFSNRIFGA